MMWALPAEILAHKRFREQEQERAEREQAALPNVHYLASRPRPPLAEKKKSSSDTQAGGAEQEVKVAEQTVRVDEHGVPFIFTDGDDEPEFPENSARANIAHKAVSCKEGHFAVVRADFPDGSHGIEVVKIDKINQNNTLSATLYECTTKVTNRSCIRYGNCFFFCVF
jgi:hypothetical protein